MFSALFTAFLNRALDRCENAILETALCILLGSHDFQLLKTELNQMDWTASISCVSCPSKVALALDRAITILLERLQKFDSKLASYDVPSLLSCICNGKAV
jgi:ABC-type Fe3+ transport system permease subunit